MTRNPFTKVAAYGKLRRALAERALEKRAQVETSIAPRDKAMRSGIDLLSRDFRTWLLRRRIRKLEQQTAPTGVEKAAHSPRVTAEQALGFLAERVLEKRAQARWRQRKPARRSVPPVGAPAQSYTNRVHSYTPEQILRRTPYEALLQPTPQYTATTNNVARLMDLHDRARGNIMTRLGLPAAAQQHADKQYPQPKMRSPAYDFSPYATNALGRAGAVDTPYRMTSLNKVHYPTVLKDRQASGAYGQYLKDVKSRLPKVEQDERTIYDY